MAHCHIETEGRRIGVQYTKHGYLRVWGTGPITVNASGGESSEWLSRYPSPADKIHCDWEAMSSKTLSDLFSRGMLPEVASETVFPGFSYWAGERPSQPCAALCILKGANREHWNSVKSGSSTPLLCVLSILPQIAFDTLLGFVHSAMGKSEREIVLTFTCSLAPPLEQFRTYPDKQNLLKQMNAGYYAGLPGLLEMETIATFGDDVSFWLHTRGTSGKSR